ncbi:MAG TPA: ABC transporter substrate-binding protein [Rhodopseudomonas sp.]|uniref:ABC transporter substrate-binding protein n=1 Tax=Rhodopseudomonas sp. TaxID=1078 RepID=UPI002ED8FFEB
MSRCLARGCRFGASILIALLTLATSALAGPARIASINMCTDQLLLALADPAQIAGLGPYASDPRLSWSAAEALRYPRLSGEAEDLLMLRPDLVLAGRYGKRTTRDLLRAKAVPVAEFDVPRSIDDVKSQIRRASDLIGHPERADALIAKIDAALSRTRAAASRPHDRVLTVSRRGWIAGSDSLTSSLLAAAGLSNAAAELGLPHGGFAALETIVASKPDLILIAEADPAAEDQGQALLLHPAIQRAYPPGKRLVIAEQLTMCGGPMLPAALDRLTAALQRVRP